MEEESGEEPGQVRSTAPKDFHYYHMDLYDAEDRPQIFPDESTRLKRETIQAEMTLEPRQARQSQVQRDLPEEVDELVHLYGLEDDHELGDEFVDEDEVGVPAYPPYGMKRGESAREQRDWRLGGEAEAEDQGYAGWGMAGQSQALREAYRYTHGCASEEYECYVIPEEEDEEEDAGLFCVTCRTPVRAVEKDFDEHKEHEVTPLNKALESAKDEIHKNMYKLEQQIIEMENFASHLEEVFITVEENFGKQEQNFESHYNEILETLAQKYEEKIQALGEKKKEKLEALYGQLVSCGENLDTCKELMETIEEMCHEEKVDFLKDAVAMTDRLGKFLKTKTDVEISAQPDFEDQTLDFSDVEQLMGSMNTIPAPCAPVINPQAPNSATGSSVRVCWSLYADDTVESYQLFYRPVRDSLPGKEQAELTVTVKETYCSVMNLEPNTQYEFWVIAQNRAGPSPSSERAVYMTGSYFPLNKATCHPWLTISEDGFTVTRSEKKSLTRDLLPHQTRFTRCVAVMGNLIPVRGRHYWEVEVDEHLDYTVGVAFEDVPKQEDLGANSLSWCMRHTFTSSRHKYEFLHNRTTPDIRISVPPKKIGVLLDYENSKLSFFNVDIAQHLYTFSCQLHQLVHPCFSLEKPGCLKIHNGVSMPTHATFY
ncbi:fibronectin type III and SPRY domain-containing protein 2 isoform X3 [Octodon degus]|uniref:Fibronectin type III and SPRY domain-containing protein 2 isoform X3 n=1 Tax=Octodon degus TaxID=10160 RepID=A0A6P6E2N3_OCTDE|nr:fibronectin type III and SPRY domain-containing protein 2 isoform X3 [Octodon degus]